MSGTRFVMYLVPLEAWPLKASPADIRTVCVCVCPHALRKLRTYEVFRKRRLTNTPRRHRLADGQLSLVYPPSPSFSSFGAASVMLCCFPPASANTPLPMLLLIEYRFQVTRVAPSTLQLRSKDRPSLPPPCLAPSLLLFLVSPLCLASSFLPCLTSSAMPRFLPPSLPPPRPFSISPPDRVAKQAAGV